MTQAFFNRVRFTIATDGRSITCTTCKLTSRLLADIRERYCANCHVFHDDEDAHGALRLT